MPTPRHQQFVNSLDNNPSPSDNFIINSYYHKKPLYPFDPGTYSRVHNMFWVERTTRNTAFNAGYNNFLAKGWYNDTSAPHGAAPIYDNCLISKWGMTGGDGTYSIEVPSLSRLESPYIGVGPTPSYQTYPLSQYMIWDSANSANQTYISLSRGSYTTDGINWYGTMSVSWYENGSPVKTVNVSHGLGPQYPVKIVWNKSTYMSYVYAGVAPGTGGTTASYYHTLLGTCSINPYLSPFGATNCSPFFAQGISTTYSLYQEDMIYSAYNGNQGICISNWQPYGLTGSSRNTSTPTLPPMSQLNTRFDIW